MRLSASVQHGPVHKCRAAVSSVAQLSRPAEHQESPAYWAAGIQVDDAMHGSARARSLPYGPPSRVRCTLLALPYHGSPIMGSLSWVTLRSTALSSSAPPLRVSVARCLPLRRIVAHCVPSLGSHPTAKMNCTLQNAVGTAHVLVYLSALLAHAACAALALTRASLRLICHTCAVRGRKCDALAPLGATTRTSCLSPRPQLPAPGTLHPSARRMSSSAQ